ncbi:MAG: WhiB family transcriptional regulator [Ilumatobacteraceae bacterium]
MYDLPTPPPAPGPWIKRGACRGEPLEFFFPPSGRRPTQALEICARCPVRADCLEYALANHQHWGVWGGMTERQRFDEKRRRRQ